MLLKNGTILTLFPANVEHHDLRVHEGNIIAKGKNLHAHGGEETVDLSGKFVLPGMVNGHTHLYSALSRGMSGPIRTPKNFVDILKKIWWKLDESLDEETIYYSTLVGSIEAIRYGTTSLIDHHASPNCIEGSLDHIKNAMGVVGLRGILCYETTDRGGRQRRDAGLDENERFVVENANNQQFRGAIGAHASFSLNDDTLKELGQLAETHDCGVHIHVAEDKADVADAMKNRGIGLVNRLDKYGILSHKSILAHGVHLSKGDLRRINQRGTWLVHNPRSNMNNAVGKAPLRWFSEHTALGTDGFPPDMFEEAKFGFFRNRESDQKMEFTRLPEVLQAGQKLVSRFFGKGFGTLAAGSAADMIALDYIPPTPLNVNNLPGHFLFGMNSGMVVHTMVNGQWAMFNRQLIGIDEEKVMSETTKVAKKLWRRVVQR